MVSTKEMVVFLLIVVALIFLAAGLLKFLGISVDLGGQLSDIEGKIPTLTLPIEEIPEGESKNVLEMLNIAPGEIPLTAGIVGCSLSKTIRDDFIANGESEHGIKLDNYGITDLLYIDSALFKINYNSQKGKYDEDKDLTPEQEKKIIQEKGCYDLVGQSGQPLFVRFLSQCPQRFDEACINSFLRGLSRNPTHDKPFCTKGEKLISPGKGQLVSFGNKDCGKSAPGRSAGGLDSYDTSCKMCESGNDDKITGYSQFPALPISIHGLQALPATSLLFLGYDKNSDGTKHFIEQQYATDDSNLGADKFLPDCGSGTCSPTYRWILYWNKNNKKYVYEIKKVPEKLDLGIITTEQIPDRLAFVFAGNGQDSNRFSRSNANRNSPAAPLYADLRRKLDITFTAANDFDFPTFIKNFKDSSSKPKGNDYKIGVSKSCTNVQGGETVCTGRTYFDAKVGQENWQENIETCFGQDCYDTDIEGPINFKKLYYNTLTESGEIGDGKNYNPIDLGDICPSNNKKLFEIDIKHNLDQGKFLKNHKYNIIVNRFLTKIEGKSEKTDGCGWGTIGCGWCWEPIQNNNGPKLDLIQTDSCNRIASRSYGDCNLAWGIPVGSVMNTRFWKDYSIIIVDLGEASAATTTTKPKTTTTTSSAVVAGRGAATSSTTTTARANLADLATVADVIAGDVSNKIKIDITINNLGTASANAGKYEYSIVNSNTGEKLSIASGDYTKIEAGKSFHTVVSPQYSHPNGLYRADVRVDSTGTTEETNENNNIYPVNYAIPFT